MAEDLHVFLQHPVNGTDMLLVMQQSHYSKYNKKRLGADKGRFILPRF
jgi:hypothetical protein